MVPWLTAYLAETWQILLELSPSLLAGLFIAGLMHLDASGLIQAIEGAGFAAFLPKKA
jgi:uncharacterized membrane protein YraQ (UPF0718 family)